MGCLSSTLASSGEALPPWGEPEEVVANVAERTTFHATLEATAKALGLSVVPDPRPEAGDFFQSSPWYLAHAGIPSFSIAAGRKFKGHDAAWGEQQERDYLEHRYRQPGDVYLPGMSFTGAARLAMLGYRLGVQAAADDRLVDWVPGDEFSAVRKRSEMAEEMRPQTPHRKTKRGRG